MLEQSDYDTMRRNLKKYIDTRFTTEAATATEAQKAELRKVWARMQGNVARMTNAQLFNAQGHNGDLLLRYVASI